MTVEYQTYVCPSVVRMQVSIVVIQVEVQYLGVVSGGRKKKPKTKPHFKARSDIIKM